MGRRRFVPVLFTIKALLNMLIINSSGASEAAAASSISRPPASDAVKVCQLGYLPGATKFAMLTANPAGDIVVRRASDGAPVLTTTAADAVNDADSGDLIRAVDFTKLAETGTYYLDVPGVGRSYDFRVGDDVFTRAFRVTMRSYTSQRCGAAVNLAPDFPQYRRDPCHLGPAQFHASSGKTGTLPCSGGWHDAGDFGRYTVNAGVTTGTLLWAYELNEAKLRKLNLDLPESGGQLPDMLAEIRWNLDWMLNMQDAADGGAWHKATTAKFADHVMPAADTAPTLIVGSGREPHKTTQATANLAAVAAIVARVYRPFDQSYARHCLDASERAFEWARAHPEAHFNRNPPGIETGAYGDKHADDELLWAAAELFRTTGKPNYNAYFLSHFAKWEPPLQGDAPQGWRDVQNMAMYAYAMSGRDPADADAVKTIRSAAVAAADDIVARAARSGYRIPLLGRDYSWGSNGVAANYAMMLLIANRIEPKPQYVNFAQDTLHYLLGRNTFNTSFVTHVGTRYALHPHHRPSLADDVKEPWPGLLVGGPNAAGGKTPPARQWVDDENEFTKNETAINWNAPLVLLLAEFLPDGAADHNDTPKVAP
jgi:endoglucanase